MTDKQKLMKDIQICDFACHEAALFLDTHPSNKNALAYFNKMRDKAMLLKDEYNKKFGPISVSDNMSADTWQWVEAPWPWEYSAN